MPFLLDLRRNSSFVMNLSTLSPQEAKDYLTTLSEKINTQFTFPELSADAKCALSAGFSHYLRRLDSQTCHLECLICIRILSRCKVDIDSLVNEDLLNSLLLHAGLTEPVEGFGHNSELLLESLKGLSNLCFQSETARTLLCRDQSFLPMLVGSLANHCERFNAFVGASQHSLKFFTLRLLFVLTALTSEIRSTIRLDLNGLLYLTEMLEDLTPSGPSAAEPLDDNRLELLGEVFKVLFNLTLTFKNVQLTELFVRLISTNFSVPCLLKIEQELVCRMALCARQLLVSSCKTEGKKHDLQSNIVNMLTALPNGCYLLLIEKGDETAMRRQKWSFYESHNMEAIQSILEFLDVQLDVPPSEHTSALSPVLVFLTDMAQSHRIFRKYLKFKILPPLTDLEKRPEEGSTLRNKLVRLMTSVTNVSGLSSDFLFILCKQSVDRLIKYTGFGNAAGMLSNRGFLGGCLSKCQDMSDDEKSDTEEYRRVKDQINPVTGCVEATKPDPLAGMSEEQKEHEVMKIVNLLDQMTRDGTIRPGRIGSDGRVEAVEHVLQLQGEGFDPTTKGGDDDGGSSSEDDD